MARHGIGRLRAGGSWFPTFLFSAGEQGAWYDPSDLSTLFQDSAGTTPVTAAGQPVGKMLDKSGRGNHLIQATAASRPVLVQPTAFYAASADGVDDFMTTTAGGGGSAGFLLCAAIKVNGGAGTVRTIWSDQGANVGYLVRIDGLDKLSFGAGNGVTFALTGSVLTLPVGETHVVTVWDDGSNLNAQVDNGAVGSVARPAVSAGSAGFSLMRNNSGAVEFFNGHFYAMVYRKGSGLTAADRAQLKTFVGAKAGLVL